MYLSGIVTLRESVFPQHADYVREFRTCVIKSKDNTSDFQMGYLVNSQFVEGLAKDAFADSTSSRSVQNGVLDDYSALMRCWRPSQRLTWRRLSTRRGTESVENHNAHRRCCGLETPAYDGSAKFDFQNVSFKSYCGTARQCYADSSCGSNGLDCAGAHDSGYNCQALRKITGLHWRTLK